MLLKLLLLHLMTRKLHLPRDSGDRSPSEEFLDQTIEVWQPRSKRKLTRDDAREIARNMTGFFRVLKEWEHEDKAQRSPSKQDQPITTSSTSKTRPLASGGSSPVGFEICPIETKCKFHAIKMSAELMFYSISDCMR
jgi:hypothetical protein